MYENEDRFLRHLIAKFLLSSTVGSQRSNSSQLRKQSFIGNEKYEN